MYDCWIGIAHAAQTVHGTEKDWTLMTGRVRLDAYNSGFNDKKPTLVIHEKLSFSSLRRAASFLARPNASAASPRN